MTKTKIETTTMTTSTTMTTDFQECCWFLWGVRIGKYFIGWLQFHSRGEPASVEFNWEKGISKFLLGWFHTHPEGYGLSPSQTDQKTMRGWVRTLERPLICGIRDLQEYKTYIFFRFKDSQICYKTIQSKIFRSLFIGKTIWNY